MSRNFGPAPKRLVSHLRSPYHLDIKECNDPLLAPRINPSLRRQNAHVQMTIGTLWTSPRIVDESEDDGFRKTSASTSVPQSFWKRWLEAFSHVLVNIQILVFIPPRFDMQWGTTQAVICTSQATGLVSRLCRLACFQKPNQRLNGSA